MNKCILDIELVHRPRPRESQRENSAHCSRFHHWIESLVIVHTGMLSKPLKDPTCLVELQSTINTALDCPKSTSRSPHCNPTDVAQGPKSGWQEELFFHRATPVRICQSLTNRRRDRRKPRLPLGGGEGSRPKNPDRLPGHHGMGVVSIPMDDQRVVHGRLHLRATWWRRRRRRCEHGGDGDGSGDGGGGGAVERRL
jgi:hypothetical protein